MPVGVMVSDCRASLDLVTIHGVEPDRVGTFRDLPAAARDALASGERTAAVGGTLARRYGWRVGDTVSLPRMGKLAFTVGAIVPETGGPTDAVILLPLPFLQRAAVGVGICNQLWVRLRPGSDVPVEARGIDAALRGHGPATHTRPEAAFLEETTADVRRLVGLLQVLAWVAVGVLCLGVVNAIGIAVRERTGELAVLRTLGYGPGLLASLVSGEAVCVALLGGAIGTGVAAALLAGSAVGIGVEGVVFRPILTAMGCVEALVVAIVVGAAGALPPTLLAMRRPIVDGLRRVD